MNREETFIHNLSKVNPYIEIIGEYKTVRHKVKCRCKLDGTEWESYPSNLLNLTAGCPTCRKPRQCKPQSKEQFVNKMKSICPNIIMVGDYINARTLSEFKCEICGHSWNARPYNFISGYGCPKCSSIRSGEKRRTKNKREIVELLNPEIEFLYVPDLTTEHCKCKCKKCGKIWETSYHNLTNPCNHTGCPHCKSSEGERQIESLLIKYKIDYEKQKKFKECKDVFELPFDFYLSKKQIAIEFDGRQHYELVPWSKDSRANELEFKKIKKHDDIKNQYCKNHGIELIRIPYWEKGNIENIIRERVI